MPSPDSGRLLIRVPSVSERTEDVVAFSGLLHAAVETSEVTSAEPESARPKPALDFALCDRMGPTAAAVLSTYTQVQNGLISEHTARSFGSLDGAHDLRTFGVSGLYQPPTASVGTLTVREASTQADRFEPILQFWEETIGPRAAVAMSASGEIIVNAAKHGDGGVVAAGIAGTHGHDPMVVLAVADLGDGIPARVRAFHRREFPGQPDRTDAEAVRWASTKGRSTWRRSGGDQGAPSPSGLGLATAQRFAHELGGRVEVITGTVTLVLGASIEITVRTTPIQGTIARLMVPRP